MTINPRTGEMKKKKKKIIKANIGLQKREASLDNALTKTRVTDFFRRSPPTPLPSTTQIQSLHTPPPPHSSSWLAIGSLSLFFSFTHTNKMHTAFNLSHTPTGAPLHHQLHLFPAGCTRKIHWNFLGSFISKF